LALSLVRVTAVIFWPDQHLLANDNLSLKLKDLSD